MKNLRRSVFAAFILLFGLSAIGCGKARTGVLPPKEEAVRLMDVGQNGKAAHILEQRVAGYPEDDEAKLLLASAYMGLAGVDVYSIFDAFQDLIFKRSLKDQVVGGNESAPKVEIARGKIPEPKAGETPAEKALRSLDKITHHLQVSLVYLDRFQKVPESQWPLIETALALLESIAAPAVDVHTYKVFIRLVYAKSYLVAKVMKDDLAWSRQWACSFDPQAFDEDLGFFAQQALAIDEDLRRAAELGSKKLAQARKRFSFLTDAASSADAYTSWNDGLTFSELENSLKGMFHCSE